MRRCRQCKTYSISKEAPKTAFTCSAECALAYVRAKSLKATKATEKAQKREAREGKAKLRAFKENDVVAQKRLTQTAFNRMICLLDKGAPCISCARDSSWKGQWHASHYRSVAAQGSLRFNALNVHKACSICNNHLSGNLRGYRDGLLHFYGQPLIDYLDKDFPPVKWDAAGLIRMRQEFNAEIRLLLAGGAPSRNWREHVIDRQ